MLFNDNNDEMKKQKLSADWMTVSLHKYSSYWKCFAFYYLMRVHVLHFNIFNYCEYNGHFLAIVQFWKELNSSLPPNEHFSCVWHTLVNALLIEICKLLAEPLYIVLEIRKQAYAWWHFNFFDVTAIVKAIVSESVVYVVILVYKHRHLFFFFHFMQQFSQCVSQHIVYVYIMTHIGYFACFHRVKIPGLLLYTLKIWNSF